MNKKEKKAKVKIKERPERLAFAKLNCVKCKNKFKIEWEYVGVITCPYCSEYVEG